MSVQNDERPLAHLKGRRPDAPAWFRAALDCAPQRTMVPFDGADIECLIWGEAGAPGILLLHGNAAHADWYCTTGPQLADRFRVVAMSWSGMGGSQWRPAYGVHHHAEEALAVARRTGLFDAPVPPLFVAHSFGSFALIAAAARHGRQLAGAVLVDAPLHFAARQAGRPPREWKQPRIYDSQAQALQAFRMIPPEGGEHLFLLDHIARASLRAVSSSPSAWTWRFDPDLMRSYERGDMLGDLAATACPLVFVRGSRSPVVDPQALAFMRQAAPGARFCEVADAGHHVMLDQPAAFSTLVGTLRALL